jgi:hypothetical protein
MPVTPGRIAHEDMIQAATGTLGSQSLFGREDVTTYGGCRIIPPCSPANLARLTASLAQAAVNSFSARPGMADRLPSNCSLVRDRASGELEHRPALQSAATVLSDW